MACVSPHVKKMLDKLGMGEQHVELSWDPGYQGYLQPEARFTFFEGVYLALALTHNESMQSLTVVDFPKELSMVVAEALKHNEALKSVIFEVGCRGPVEDVAPDDAGMALADILKHNCTLDSVKFELGDAYDDDVFIGANVGKAIADGLTQNATLKSFGWETWSDHVSEALAAFADAVEFSPALKSFRFVCPTKEIALSIADALKHNEALESLALISNGDLEVAMAVSDALKSNITLKSFTLENQDWDNSENTRHIKEFAKVIADGLKHNVALEHFAYICTARPDEAHSTHDCEDAEVGGVMADALKHHPRLKSFALDVGFDIRTFGVAMADAVKYNIRLESFALGGKFEVRASDWDGDNAFAVPMADVLKHNSKLKSFKWELIPGCNGLQHIQGYIQGFILAGMALAEALKHNGKLESFEFGHAVEFGHAMSFGFVSSTRDIRMENDAERLKKAFADSSKQNVSLKSFSVRLPNLNALDPTDTLWSFDKISHTETQRNQEMLSQCRVLALLARGSHGHILTEFRRSIFSFFLPSHCTPAQTFIDLGMAGKPQLSAMSHVEASDKFAPDLEPADPDRRSPQPESSDLIASGLGHRERTDDYFVQEEKKEQQLHQAIELSEQDAVVRVNSDVAHAIMRSKADAPVSDDGVIVMRLTKLGHYTEVMAALTSSDHLCGPVSRVTEAGCEVRPSWTPALLLVPLTQSQIEELGMELRAHHIVGYKDDHDLVRAALSALCSKRRPSVAAPAMTSAIAHCDEHNLTRVVDNCDFDDIEVEIKYTVEIKYRNTFLDYRIPKDISEATAFHESAPCGDSSAIQPVNARRYISK